MALANVGAGVLLCHRKVVSAAVDPEQTAAVLKVSCATETDAIRVECKYGGSSQKSCCF